MRLSVIQDGMTGRLRSGSGLSFHKFRLRVPGVVLPSRAFDQWLHQTLEGLQPAESSARLLQRANAPAARIAHPQEDHLVPVMVALGAGES